MLMGKNERNDQKGSAILNEKDAFSNRREPLGRRPMSPGRALCLGFLALILLGGLLLTLPAASAGGESIGFLKGLFTATSAVCVTGLSLIEAGRDLSLFGQIVLLCLIQVGGLGFMAFATLGMVLIGRRISLHSRILLSESMNQNGLSGMVRLSLWFFAMALAIELTGAALLAVRLVPRYGTARGLWLSLFTAVSAFCNAGFDLFGNGSSLLLTPGFIDSHVHVLGGGGEGGFANRTPEATLEGLTKFGVTTVVGCLGTDGIGRDMCSLVAKTKGLNEQGMSAYCYTGSYQIPVHTLTDSITKDIMMIQEIIGTGEIAISDHRSSQPTFEEFARVVADTRLGGVLSGKAGIVNVHLGDSPRCMDLIERVIDETEIPASQLLPTHVNRNEMLFCKAIEYALKGGAVDFTGNEDIDYWETICDEVRVCKGMKRMLEAGVNPNRMTISSDGQGSLPMYSKDGEFLGMGVGQSSCLLKEVKECVFKADIPLEIALSTITSNPAEILRLKGKGKIEEGYDADLCILDQDLQLVEVIARGKTVYTK